MYNVGEYLVYKKDVCKIKAIKKNHLNNKDYYVLTPIDYESLIIDTPVDNKCGYIRNLISKEETEHIIDTIPNVSVIDGNTKNVENEYKTLLLSGTHENLIKIIKTTYLRNKERQDSNRKIGDKDNQYFKKSEKYLYNELGVVLNMNVDEVRRYIIDKVSKMESKNE